jgi:hypothetical protein
MPDGEFIPIEPVPQAIEPIPELPPLPTPEPRPPLVVVPPITEPLPPPTGVPEALPDLGLLSGLIVLLGLIALAVAIAEVLNWLARWALGPLFKRAGSPQMSTQTLTQPLSNALGKSYSKIDGNIGLSFLKIGEMTGRVGSAILAGEQAAYIAATKIGALSGVSTRHELTTSHALQQAKQARREAAQAAQQAELDRQAALQRAKGLDARLSALETHVTTLIEPEIDGLKHLIPNIEKGVAATWDELAKHGEALGIAGLTAGVAVALKKLGVKYIECEANQLLGKAACGAGPNAIKNLLEGLVGLGALLDLCALVGLLEDAAKTGPVQDILKTLVLGGEDLLKCRGVKSYTPSPVDAPSLSPTVFAYAKLAPVV